MSAKDEIEIRKRMLEAVSRSPLLKFMAHNSAETTELRNLLARSRLLTFPAGSLIIQEGERSASMYFLAAGSVSVHRQGKKICTLDRMGEVFGEIGAITGEARTATVKAQTQVTCLVTDPALTRRLTEEGNSVFMHILQQALAQVLTGRLNATSKALAAAEDRIEKQAQSLAALEQKMKQLERENESLHAQLRTGMHGPRSGRPKPVKEPR